MVLLQLNLRPKTLFSSGLRAQGTGHRARGTGLRAQGTGHRAQGTERRENPCLYLQIY